MRTGTLLLAFSVLATCVASVGGIRTIAPRTDDPTRFGGSPYGGFRDGPGDVARYYHPQGIAVSPDGREVFIADSWNHRIRRVDVATGQTTTLAGSVPGFQDGEAHAAAFHYPNSLAISPDGGFIFVSDSWNHRIRAVVLGTGVVTTVAGKGFPGFRDGSRTEARFYYPAGIALSPDGTTLFVSDSWNNKVRAIKVRSGETFTVAGGVRGYEDGPANEAMFSQPRGIDISRDGQTLYVADTGNNRIRAVILASKAVVTLAGSGVRGFRDGDPLDAQFARPTGVLAALEGDQVFVADGGNAMVRSVPVPPDLAKVTAEGGYEAAGPGEVFTVSRAPSTVDDDPKADVNKPGILGGKGHVGNQRNSDFGFGATAVEQGAGKAILGKMTCPYDLGTVPSEARGKIFLTDRDSHTVFAMDVSTGRASPLSGIGVAPVNAVGAIYDSSRKRPDSGVAQFGAAQAGSGPDAAAETHAVESDWMREAMVEAARTAGDASLAGALAKPTTTADEHSLTGSAAKVARQHHTWWFGSSRPAGLGKTSTGAASSDAGDLDGGDGEGEAAGEGALWAWVIWAAAALGMVYVAGIIHPEAAAVARRIATLLVTRIVNVVARLTERPRAASQRVLARVRRSALWRSASLAMTRCASAASALAAPILAKCGPSLRRLRPWIAAIHIGLASVLRRLPVAMYAYCSPAFAPVERWMTRSRVVARMQRAFAWVRPLARAFVVFSVELQAAVRAAFRRAATAARDGGAGGGGDARQGAAGGGATWAPHGSGLAGKSRIAPDGSVWPDSMPGGYLGNRGAAAGAPPGTRVMRHPPRMDRMPADVATSLAAQRMAAGPGMVMPPKLNEPGGNGMGGGRISGRGMVAVNSGPGVDPLGGEHVDFAPPSRMMDLAGSKSPRSDKEL